MNSREMILKTCEGECFAPCKELAKFVPAYVIAIILLIIALFVLILAFKKIDLIIGKKAEKRSES